MDLNISPLILGSSNQLERDFSLDSQPGSQSSSRPISRPPSIRSTSSRRLLGRPSRDRLASPRLFADDLANATVAALESDNALPVPGHPTRPAVGALSRAYEAFFIQRLQLQTWLKAERKRRAAKRMRKRASLAENKQSEAPTTTVSEGDAALDELEVILDRALGTLVPREATIARRDSRTKPLTPSSLLMLKEKSVPYHHRHRQVEADHDVPHCDVVLDNSNTLAYAEQDPFADVGPSPNGQSAQRQPSISAKEKEAWKTFKLEILKITHTLRLRRWRHIPLERSNDITVNRLSGALTNAVYVVCPPANLIINRRPSIDQGPGSMTDGPNSSRPIPKLLLRIYGPHVEHLIDRQSELAMLKRLAKHNIGPRLLGSFANGRFEEFLNARPLTSLELRDQGTSRMIAKRMRELHDAMELLPAEVGAGPMVWRNWEKWLTPCTEVLARIDSRVERHLKAGSSVSTTASFVLPYVCGAPWTVFRDAVERYREWLLQAAGGEEEIKNRLVFAHNDAQYGNILRMTPSGESPLLQPMNQHKQLVVIDFEYANANVPGLEFANHFTEWCYDYHDSVAPYACQVSKYPRTEEQKHFLNSYVAYNPGSNHQLNQTPVSQPSSTASTSVSNLLGTATTQSNRFGIYPLANASAQPGHGNGRLGRSVSEAEGVVAGTMLEKIDEKNERQGRIEKETERLLYEARIWRPANSAQWVAWGVVQAKTSSHDSDADSEQGQGQDQDQDKVNVHDDGTASQTGEENDSPVEFDYLAYAQSRAIFFWADLVDLGIISLHDLPRDLAEVVGKVKIW